MRALDPAIWVANKNKKNRGRKSMLALITFKKIESDSDLIKNQINDLKKKELRLMLAKVPKFEPIRKQAHRWSRVPPLFL
jgi:hypothetical protein